MRPASESVGCALRQICAVVAVALSLSACATAPDTGVDAPSFDIARYFEGRTEGSGVIERGGRIVERFEMVAVGSIAGDTLTLDETFAFSDGSTFRRAWRMRSPRPGTWLAEADNVAGRAEITVRNGVARMRYLADFPRGDGTIRLRFDQMLTPLRGDIVLNRSFLSVLGYPVGSVTVVFEKPTR